MRCISTLSLLSALVALALKTYAQLAISPTNITHRASHITPNVTVITNANPPPATTYTNIINTVSGAPGPQVCILQVAENPESKVWRDALFFNPATNLTNWVRSNCAPNSFYRVGNYGMNNPTN